MKISFVPIICLTVFSFIFKNNELTRQYPKSDGGNPKSIMFDDPNLINGLIIEDFNHMRCIQLKPGSTNGLAEIYFFDESAKYNISISYIDETNGKSAVELSINNKPVGDIKFDAVNAKAGASYSIKQKTIPGIDIQKWSKITLQFAGNGGEKCRIEKLVLTPVGTFDGKQEKLAKPVTMDVFQGSEEKLMGKQVLSTFVNSRIDSLMNKRVAELGKLKTPSEWRASQNKTRERLDSFLGKFPERTPLNAKITGKIDHEKYTIEKLYFESRPHYYVTANLYIPKNRALPLPGVLFTCGHSDNGKDDLLYHQTCLGLVLKGYIVLAIDPMGQGERIEYFNSETKEENVEGAVSQHYYLGRPSFLVNKTFSGLRTWDCIRAVDYLVSRPEVDTAKLGSVGNSGGGQMALLITAVDERIKVCAAGHPGGQMEKNYLPGQNLIDRQIFSLIAPRPVRIIVGDKSGEEAPHRKKIEDIQLFDEGLGFNKDRAELKLVDGVHDMKLPKREAAYDWLNRWLGKEEEGKTEPPLNPEDEKSLWVTKSGLTLLSLGGETGQSLNEQQLKNIYRPAKDNNELKKRIANRIQLSTDKSKPDLKVHSVETIAYSAFSIEKLSYESEDGIIIPSLLIRPKNIKSNSPVYIYASERGKPRLFQDTLTPFQLAENGYIVLAIDVRGVGETNPTASLPLPVKYSTCTPMQWIHDCLAIQSPGFGRTMLGMRTFDVMRGIDFLQTRKELKDKKVIIYGEGIGGLWATLASIYDSRVSGVITDGTLTSYKQLVNNKYYAVPSAYFWGAPGVLCDFDISDLVRLASVKQQIWLNPINEMGEIINASQASGILGHYRNTHVVIAKQNATKAVLNSLH
jgi:cephalosporin-C deacetylase-like acetyl esterase